jgi:hypothetical protein
VQKAQSNVNYDTLTNKQILGKDRATGWEAVGSGFAAGGVVGAVVAAITNGQREKLNEKDKENNDELAKLLAKGELIGEDAVKEWAKEKGYSNSDINKLIDNGGLDALRDYGEALVAQEN